MRIYLIALGALALISGAAQADPKWNGPYGGVSFGAAFEDAKTTDTNGGVTPGPFGFSGSGLVAGGQAGYNLLVRSILVGVEGDVGYMDFDALGNTPSSVPGHSQALRVDGGAYGDITARVGLLVTPYTLVYGKGGAAFFDGSASQTTNNPGYVTNASGSFAGWTAGGGVEHFVTDKVSLKLEYQHFDFGSEAANQTSVGDPPIGFVYKNKTDLTSESVKAAVIYHF